MRKRILTQQAGIGLIEVLVTIIITTIGLLGLSAMQMQSIRSVSDVGNRGQAIWIANDLINRIRANEIAAGSYVTNGEINCDEIENVRMSAAYSVDGVQIPPDANCTNQDLALFDQYDALCGTSAITGENAFSSAASYMGDATLSIADLGNENLQITISWNSRSAGTNNAGEEVFYLEKGQMADESSESYTVTFRP